MERRFTGCSFDPFHSVGILHLLLPVFPPSSTPSTPLSAFLHPPLDSGHTSLANSISSCCFGDHVVIKHPTPISRRTVARFSLPKTNRPSIGSSGESVLPLVLHIIIRLAFLGAHWLDIACCVTSIIDCSACLLRFNPTPLSTYRLSFLDVTSHFSSPTNRHHGLSQQTRHRDKRRTEWRFSNQGAS